MRARDLSVPEPVAVKVTFLSESGESTSLVAEAATEETIEKKEGRSLKSVGLAAGAGIAGFGSVFILRKGGGKKKDVTPQQWAEKKQEEWKVRAYSQPTRARCLTHPKYDRNRFAWA